MFKTSLTLSSIMVAAISGSLLTHPLLAKEDETSPPKLQLAPHLTVSGLSSGGYFAAQFHLAFANEVKGAAILAAGPVYCAKNDLMQALGNCMNQPTATPDLPAINQYLATQQAAGKLAPATALADSKVWLFSGSADATVLPQVSTALYQQYQQWIPKEALRFINDQPFAHHFPTNQAGFTACDKSESPFIASCNYDTSGQLLSHLLGAIKPPASQASGQLVKLQQHQLAPAAAGQLAAEGYLYIPESCASGAACRLHISFHGCKQDVSQVGDAYIRHTGLNEYADTNQLVILYPQVEKSAMAPFNPNGCWDWWGYSGEHYATIDGPQLKAVKQLVEALRQ
ncbi:MAG: PHB depolymerase family esterase [Alishewanella agri]|nr:PHB depolymerase family esterase [Alishewanella agri]